MARFVTVALDGLVNLAPGDMAAAKGPLPAWPRAYDSELSALPAGRQIFWGIPLALAPEGGPRWVELACGPVTIPLEGRASYLVVAHFCNASQVGCVGDGGLGYVTRPGEHLADYVLVYSDGNEHRQAIRRRFEIRPGQRELVLPLERPFDLRARGWVTADTHVHFLSPQTAWLEAQAEGLNLLASQWGDLFTNVGDLTGALSGVSTGDTLVWVGTENRQHIMGHISLLGVRGEPVFPLTTAGPEESYIGDPIEASLAEWADRCRAREGLAILPHFPNPHLEAAADIILGKIDGVEIRYFSPGLDHYHLREWYRVLNLGYRMAAVGGTDKMSAGMPVGGVRTYAHLGDEEFSFQSWACAVRAGRIFTNSGPLIGLAVEGHAPGDEVRLPAGGRHAGCRGLGRLAATDPHPRVGGQRPRGRAGRRRRGHGPLGAAHAVASAGQRLGGGALCQPPHPLARVADPRGRPHLSGVRELRWAGTLQRCRCRLHAHPARRRPDLPRHPLHPSQPREAGGDQERLPSRPGRAAPADARAWGRALTASLISSTRYMHHQGQRNMQYAEGATMAKQLIKTPNAPQPIGPYSQAVVANGFVYVAGQGAIDPATGKIVAGGIAEQTRQVLENIKHILEAAGCSMADVVSNTVYMVNLGDFAAMNAVYAEYFQGTPPARTTVGVASLPGGTAVEITTIAALPGR